MRGRLLQAAICRVPVRSIPAGAGETWARRAGTRARQVDPRGCGGDQADDLGKALLRGRSPRVRGRHEQRHDLIAGAGSIPAGAGETEKVQDFRVRPTVDPRGCGGDRPTFAVGQILEGRSPRVRGRPGPGSRRAAAARSIPAGAGETSSGSGAQCPHRVDPRGCGGDLVVVDARSDDAGRSPRVRGRLGPERDTSRREGSIPAGAGETLVACALIILQIVKER